jgi:outer membrane cobalamin receptor
MGGVVNIITAIRRETPILLLGVSNGSFNSYDFRGGLNSFILCNPTSLNAKYEHTDGFRPR